MNRKLLWVCIGISIALVALLFYYKGVTLTAILIALLLAPCLVVLLWASYKSERGWNGDRHAKH